MVMKIQTRVLLAEKEHDWQRRSGAPRILTWIPLRGNGETKWQREAQKNKGAVREEACPKQIGNEKKRGLQKPSVGRERSGKRRAKTVLR